MNKISPTLFVRVIATIGVSLSLFGCGGGGGGSSPTPSQPVVPALDDNQALLVLDAGPPGVRVLNELFTSVTICAPGTSTCQTIDHILVDTGSSGLRVMASALSSQLLSSLPLSTDSSGNTIAECAQFVTGYAWGPTRLADVKLAQEVASNTPIQVIGDADFSVVPTACSGTGPAENTVQTLGANGVLGISVFAQDCGQACVTQSDLGMYYSCAGSACTPASVPLPQQLWNPIALFPADNNGSSIALPAVPLSAATLYGTLTFGIGTQANNGLGSATVLTLDPTTGELSSTVEGITYAASFLDSGSNAYFYGTNLFPQCAVFVGFYCPPSPISQAGVLQSVNGASVAANFTVANPEALLAFNSAISVDPDIAGPGFGSLFDWGLPFFLGRTVFTAIENRATPSGSGPYIAID